MLKPGDIAPNPLRGGLLGRAIPRRESFAEGDLRWLITLEESHNTERARACIKVLAREVGQLNEKFVWLAEALVVAAGTNRGEERTEG